MSNGLDQQLAQIRQQAAQAQRDQAQAEALRLQAQGARDAARAAMEAEFPELVQGTDPEQLLAMLEREIETEVALVQVALRTAEGP